MTGGVRRSAEILLARLARDRGDRDAAFAAAFAAVELLRDLPASKEQAEALSDLAAIHAVWGESDEALTVGAQALELAETFGLHEIKAESLTFRGHARILGGDRGGLADVEQAVEITLALNSPGIVRRSANLATSLVELGDLGRAWEVYEIARDAARRFGDAPGLHWWPRSGPTSSTGAATGTRRSRPPRARWARPARATASSPDGGSVRGSASRAATSRERWRTRSPRSSSHGARRGACRPVRGPRAPRACPCRGGTHVDEAAAVADELLALLGTPGVLASFWTAELADALVELERADRAGRRPSDTRLLWLDAARSLVARRVRGRRGPLRGDRRPSGGSPSPALAHPRRLPLPATARKPTGSWNHALAGSTERSPRTSTCERPSRWSPGPRLLLGSGPAARRSACPPPSPPR